jgi:RNA polymerase sigma-70 factor (ECF subfamily)
MIGSWFEGAMSDTADRPDLFPPCPLFPASAARAGIDPEPDARDWNKPATRPVLEPGDPMEDDEDRRRFVQLALPHAGAAYNLARWLTRNEQDAQDVAQEAMVRALRYIGTFHGDNARPWLLQIVRHACFSWLRENRPAERTFLDDDDDSLLDVAAPASDEPPALAVRKAERREINEAIAALPAAYREVLILRELEDLSYADIARIAEIPVGTVMSRLSRARGLMRTALAPSARPVLRTVPRAANGGTP